jgi:hypothetical protein
MKMGRQHWSFPGHLKIVQPNLLVKPSFGKQKEGISRTGYSDFARKYHGRISRFFTISIDLRINSIFLNNGLHRAREPK